MIATQITTRAPSYFSKVKREHRERLDSQISRVFTRNLRITNIVANLTRVYLLPYENANGGFRCQLQYFPANASAARLILLEEIGVNYDLVLVDRASDAQKSKDYLKINPNGRIPTRVDGELIVSEAAAIMLHLVDRHADGGLAPQIGTLERARFYQWLTFLTNSLPEELMISQYPDRLAGRDASAADVVRQGAEGRASRFLDVIEDHLKAKQPTVSRQPAEGRRFLSGHALALDAPDGRPAAFAPQHRNASRQGDGPPLGPTRAHEQEGLSDGTC